MHEFVGGGIALTVDAADGGRITSLVAHDREWLAPATARSPHGSFTARPPGGWDEVAPTVAACELPDATALRDHGDAWRTPWSVSGDSMSVQLDSVGVRLERVIRASVDGVRLQYRATTESLAPVPLLWSAHPLFDASDGARIVASGELTGEYPVRGAPVPWPPSIIAGAALKAFASGITEAAIEHGGTALRMRWSLPHVGFYWDGGQFSDRPVVAIEPSTGVSDSAARVLDELPTVAAGRPLEWWLELSL